MKKVLLLVAATLTLVACNPTPTPPASDPVVTENPKADECPRADGQPCK